MHMQHIYFRYTSIHHKYTYISTTHFNVNEERNCELLAVFYFLSLGKAPESRLSFTSQHLLTHGRHLAPTAHAFHTSALLRSL